MFVIPINDCSVRYTEEVQEHFLHLLHPLPSTHSASQISPSIFVVLIDQPIYVRGTNKSSPFMFVVLIRVVHLCSWY